MDCPRRGAREAVPLIVIFLFLTTFSYANGVKVGFFVIEDTKATELLAKLKASSTPFSFFNDLLKASSVYGSFKSANDVSSHLAISLSALVRANPDPFKPIHFSIQVIGLQKAGPDHWLLYEGTTEVDSLKKKALIVQASNTQKVKYVLRASTPTLKSLKGCYLTTRCSGPVHRGAYSLGVVPIRYAVARPLNAER